MQGGGSDEASVLELKADNEKLRALVTVGQDASRQQEELIEQLQKELAATKVGTNLCLLMLLGWTELYDSSLSENSNRDALRPGNKWHTSVLL